mgnify:FL=1
MKNNAVRMFKFETNMLGLKCNPLLLLLCFVLGSLLGTFVLCSCSKISFVETFTNYLGTDINYSIGDGVRSSYINKNLEEANVQNNQSVSTVSPSDILNKSMNIFSETKFSQDCCPSSYTTSAGCACNTDSVQDFINKRGNNRSSCDVY